MPKKPPHEDTLLVRAAEKKLFARFSEKLRPLGFNAPVRARFWTRPGEHCAHFLHFHRGGSSYACAPSLQISYRIHPGIRVMNDPTHFLVLNGPTSDQEGTLGFHLRCHARNEDTYDRCVTDVGRWCVEIAQPWFERFDRPDVLITRPDTPLTPEARQALEKSLEGTSDERAIAASRKLLGIKA